MYQAEELLLFQKDQNLLQQTKHRACHIIVIPPLKQWMSGILYKVCEVHEKCNNTDTNPALLQIRSTPVGLGLASLSTVVFNQPLRGLMLRINRSPIKHDKDEENHDTIVK